MNSFLGLLGSGAFSASGAPWSLGGFGKSGAASKYNKTSLKPTNK